MIPESAEVRSDQPAAPSLREALPWRHAQACEAERSGQEWVCTCGLYAARRAALASSDPGSPSDGGPYTEAGRKLHNDLASMMTGRPSHSNEWVRVIRQMIPLIEEQAHQLGMLRALSGSPSDGGLDVERLIEVADWHMDSCLLKHRTRSQLERCIPKIAAEYALLSGSPSESEE